MVAVFWSCFWNRLLLSSLITLFLHWFSVLCVIFDVSSDGLDCTCLGAMIENLDHPESVCCVKIVLCIVVSGIENGYIYNPALSSLKSYKSVVLSVYPFCTNNFLFSCSPWWFNEWYNKATNPRCHPVFFAYLLTKLHDQTLSYRFSRRTKTSFCVFILWK